MKCFWVVLSLSLFMAWPSGQACAQSSIEYWNQTGIKMQDFEENALSLCYESEKTLMGCVNAINIMAGLLPTQKIYASAEEEGLPYIGALIKRFESGLNEYQFIDYKPDTKLTNFNLKKEKISRHWSAVQKLYLTIQKDPSKKTDFKKLSADLKVRVLVGQYKDAESFLAYTLFESFLKDVYDPHTHIDPVKEVEAEMNHPSDSIVGIGALLRLVQGHVEVESVMPGSPSEKAGLKSSDQIVSVDGTRVTKNFKEEDVVKLIRGIPGTSVAIEIFRANQNLNFVITRTAIEVKNVTTEVRKDAGVPYGYIKIRSFMDDSTGYEVGVAVETLQAQNVHGIILDLRGNRGGLMSQAVSVVATFVGHQKVVTVKNIKNLEIAQDRFGDHLQLTGLPMVTLIDAESSSASEIVAGALQYYHRSWVVGQRSSGKGTAQSARYFRAGENDFKNSIYIFRTRERFFLPSGRSNQIYGITPNFVVAPFFGATEEDLVAYREGDRYFNAIEATGKPWKEDRIRTVSKIQSCQSKLNDLSALGDLPLLWAQTVLRCDQNAYLGFLREQKRMMSEVATSPQG